MDSNWPDILKLGVSLSVAVLGIYLWNNQEYLLKLFREHYSNAKSETKKSIKTTIEHVEKKIENYVDELKEKYLSPETKEVLEDIEFLIDHVKKYDDEGKPYRSSIFILLAIVKKVQNLSEFQQWETNLSNITNVSPKTLKESKYFSEFAFNVYSAAKLSESDVLGVAEILSVSSEDILFTELQDDEGEGLCPKFVFLVDHRSKSLVLSIRGTKSLKDALLDMVCDDAPFIGGFAHSGILSGTQKVMSLVQEKIQDACKQYPEYELVITGHSLGAGVAVLISLDLLIGEKSIILPDSTQIRCFAFAPPPVFRSASDGSSISDNVMNKINIIINNHDCIPRTSLGSITRLLKSLRAVDKINLTLRQQFQILRHTVSSKLNSEDDNYVMINDEKEDKENGDISEVFGKVVESVDKAAQDKFPYLQHPGRVIYLKKQTVAESEVGDNEKYVALAEESFVTPNRLFLLNNMIMDHRRPSYRRALQDL